jgi:predicted small lipoprotein YifL
VLIASGRQDALRFHAAKETSKEATLRVLRGLLALLTCLAFSGCVLRGPEIELKPPVEIKAEPEGRFCPPGQAKKGNC